MLSLRVLRLPFVAVFVPRLRFLAWCSVFFSALPLSFGSFLLACGSASVAGFFAVSSFVPAVVAVPACLFFAFGAFWFGVALPWFCFVSAVVSFLPPSVPFVVSRRSGAVLLFWADPG